MATYLLTGSSVSYVINPISSGTVDATYHAQIQALDVYGNVATSEQRSVSAHVNGSSTIVNSGSSTALVSIHNGIGSFSFIVTHPAIITASLIDSQSTHLNVQSVQTLSVTFGMFMFIYDNHVLTPHKVLLFPATSSRLLLEPSTPQYL